MGAAVTACAVACARSEPVASAQDVPADAGPEPVEAPFPEAPAAPDSRAVMPTLGAQAPPFPYLPEEDQELSRSVGTSSDGYLVEGKTLVVPWPHLAMLDVQSRRDLNHSTDRVLGILDAASAFVASRHPGAVVYLGNMGREGGGDIPYSISHNSGRDADIAFMVKGADGLPAVMPTLLPLDESGRYEGEHGVYEFDVERSWSLARGLIEHAGDDLQYLFVANWLRDAMIAHAEAAGEPAEVVARAKKAMRQPTASLPHNDHFHLRVYCSVEDYASGCKDTGRRQPWYRGAPRRAARLAAVRAAKGALSAPEAEVRAAGARRLALLGASGMKGALVERLSDEDALVRAAAARALGELGTGGGELAMVARVERDPSVVAEIVGALGRIGGKASADALARLLELARSVEVVEGVALDVRALASDALATMESERGVAALVGALEADSPEVRARAARALRMTTNHAMMEGSWATATEDERVFALERWREWVKTHGKKTRDEWLVLGFKEAGYLVERLTGTYVWEICRAVPGADHLSYNAQRALMRIAKRRPATLTWSKQDADFYWRRWFERRRRRYGVPPVPEGMSTLAE
jgi:penicillin-insensitive murein endopeptidase